MEMLALLLIWSVVLLLLHILAQSVLFSKELGQSWNLGPRDGGEVPQSVFAQRAQRASANFRETYPAFLGLMLVTYFHAFDLGLFTTGALLWLFARVAYWPVYMAGIRNLRSLIWVVSVIGLVLMLLAFWI